MVDGQVTRSVGGAAVARTPVAVLTAPGSQHPGAEPLPGARAVDRAVPARAGPPRVRRAAATRAAGDDTADRAQLHPDIVRGAVASVYSPAVLGLRDYRGADVGR